MSQAKEKQAHLTLLKGGKLDSKEFQRLPLEEKVLALRRLTGPVQAHLILQDPDAKKLVSELSPQELYLAFKEAGENESFPLLSLAESDQLLFFLDIELWDGWKLDRKKALEWLELILEYGDAAAARTLTAVDPELLILILIGELRVGGGVGDLLSDEERLQDWDQSFDDIFMIKYKNSGHTPLLSRLIELLYREDHPLYLTVMEGIKNEIESELEELSYKFRSDRLADEGFPPLEEALSVYAPADPERYVVSGHKEKIISDAGCRFPIPVSGETFLDRAMTRIEDEGIEAEMGFLITTVLTADRVPLDDPGFIRMAMERVHGYLNVALEYLAGSDIEEAARILRTEYLKRLFQLAHGLISQVRATALSISNNNLDYPTSRALEGLRYRRPRYYRGLDPDHTDDFREFRTLADVHEARRFLKSLLNG